VAHLQPPKVLRSGFKWSVGSTALEDSIRQAYLTLIRDAKRFIYIEVLRRSTARQALALSQRRLFRTSSSSAT